MSSGSPVMAEAETSTREAHVVVPKRDYKKCWQCRIDRKKCEPHLPLRPDGKCNRCYRLGRDCGGRKRAPPARALIPSELSQSHDLDGNNHHGADVPSQNSDPDGLEYMDRLASFHQQFGTHLSRYPSVDRRPLDLYMLKKAVESRGGFAAVCNDEEWAEIGRELGYKGKIMSSLSVSLKTAHQRWVHPYEEWLKFTGSSLLSELGESTRRSDPPSTSGGSIEPASGSTPLVNLSPARSKLSLGDYMKKKESAVPREGRLPLSSLANEKLSLRDYVSEESSTPSVERPPPNMPKYSKSRREGIFSETKSKSESKKPAMNPDGIAFAKLVDNEQATDDMPISNGHEIVPGKSVEAVEQLSGKSQIKNTNRNQSVDNAEPGFEPGISNEIFISSLMHPPAQSQDWSTLPSSRNSIYPTITASASPPTNYPAVWDLDQSSRVADDGRSDSEHVAGPHQRYEHGSTTSESQDYNRFEKEAQTLGWITNGQTRTTSQRDPWNRIRGAQQAMKRDHESTMHEDPSNSEQISQQVLPTRFEHEAQSIRSGRNIYQFHDSSTQQDQRLTATSHSRYMEEEEFMDKSQKFFACPYAEFDPLRYAEGNYEELHYRGCAGGLYRDVSRVKQHLKRLHHYPDFYCHRCFTIFDSNERLKEHHLQEKPCVITVCPFPERLDKTQQREIHVKRPGKNPEELWYDIFRIIFPGRQVPLTPYIKVAPPMSDRYQDLLAQNSLLKDPKYQEVLEYEHRKQLDEEDSRQHTLPQHQPTPNNEALDLPASVSRVHESYLDQGIEKPSPISEHRLKSLLPPNHVRIWGVTSLTIGSWQQARPDRADLNISYSLETASFAYWLDDDPDRGRIEFPFSFIQEITWTDSFTSEMQVVVIRLTEPPSFIADTYIGRVSCTDFTKNQQASQVLEHCLEGNSALIIRQFRKLVSLPQYKDRFQKSESLIRTTLERAVNGGIADATSVSSKHSDQSTSLPALESREKDRKMPTECFTCKERQITCGLELPVCHNCRALDRVCIYLPMSHTSPGDEGHLNSPDRALIIARSTGLSSDALASHQQVFSSDRLRTDFGFSGLAWLGIGSWRRTIYSSEELAISYSTETERITYHMEIESTRYKITYPFGHIKDIRWNVSSFGVAQVTVELTETPSFFVGGTGGDYKRGDFTENQQASQILFHIWESKEGWSDRFTSELYSLMSLSSYQQRFQRFMSRTKGASDPSAESEPHLYANYEPHGGTCFGPVHPFTSLDNFNQMFPSTSKGSSIYEGGTVALTLGNVPTDSGYASLARDKLICGTIEAASVHLNHVHDDAKTIYSDGASIETSQRDNLIDRLAELLKQSLNDIMTNELAVHEVFDDIKDCLADFAMRLGQEDSSPKLRRAMAFIHKYRSLVGDSFKSLYQQDANEEEDSKRESTDNMPLGELMNRWFNDEILDAPVTALEDLAIIEDETPLDDSILHENPSELDDYSDLIRTSESYKWLLSRLRNRVLLNHDDSDVCQNIRETVLAYIPKEAVVKVGVPSRMVQAMFVVDWPIGDFLQAQLDSKAEATSLGSIVALTGVPPDIQAMTCNDYLSQTWPTTGTYLMKVIEGALEDASFTAEIRRPDGASLIVTFEEMVCTVAISGTRDMVTELAEQLSWLSAALRSPLVTTNIMTCTPIITGEKTAAKRKDPPAVLNKLHTTLLKGGRNGHGHWSMLQDVARDSGNDNDAAHLFEICFVYEELDLQAQQGMCWQHVLPYCSIVNGFPIRRRPEVGLGMEVPLNIMAGLIGTKRVNQYRETIYVRGFSAVYSPTRVIDDTIVWHLTCDNTGSHVSYRDVTNNIEHIGFADLENKRHIVGWCTSVTDKIDTDGVVHTVAESQLPGTRPGCVLDGFLLTFPKEIVHGPTFALLQCQRSIHLASATYRAKLKYLRDHFALLWDTEDDRGWLTNCLSAFLHLVRDTFVSYDASTKAELMSLWSKLRVIAQSIPTGRSVDSIAHCSSWPLPDQGCHTLSDTDSLSIAQVAHQIFTRVCDQLFDGLDKLITFQEQVEYDDSRRPSRSLRLLEGWNFPDLASEHGSKRARMMSLPTVAFSWAKLLRSLGTITIFGERFGELLAPCKQFSQPRSNTPPHGNVEAACRNLYSSRFLVAVAMRDLHAKMRKFKHCAGALLLGDAAILPRYGSVFTNCSRQHNLDECMPGSHKSILMPWPVAHRKVLPVTSPACQCEILVCPENFAEHYIDGAIVLGHDEEAGYYLDETGNPVKGNAPDPAVEQEAFNDSGFGTDTSRVSQENGVSVSRHTARWVDETSTKDSGVFLEESGQRYNDSIVNGGAPVYGNIYVTNNNQVLAATQTSHIGVQGTSTPGQQHLSVPALLNWTPNNTDQDNFRRSNSVSQHRGSFGGSKRSRSDSDEDFRPAKRQTLPSLTWEQQSTLRDTNRGSRSATPENRYDNRNHPSTLHPRITTVDHVKRCCRCRTAMSLEKLTDVCEECIHEFCIRCGVLNFDSQMADG